LDKQGIRSLALPLTSVGEDASVLGDFYTDARAVREVLDCLQPPVLLCGHSYGGAVITEAAAGPHPAVRQLVYLAATAPGPGDSGASLASPALAVNARTNHAGQQAEAIIPQGDGTGILDRDQARVGLFGDCDPQRAEHALTQLGRMNLAVSTQAATAAAWRDLPATYVRCTQDLLPELLAPGFLDRVTQIVELPTAHCPQWSRPDLVADLLMTHARSLLV